MKYNELYNLSINELKELQEIIYMCCDKGIFSLNIDKKYHNAISEDLKNISEIIKIKNNNNL